MADNASTFGFSLDPSKIGGGITYQAPGFTFGQNQAINGGFNFDLPLATAAQFNNAALAFTQANSDNNRGFLENALSRNMASVDAANQRSAAFSTTALKAITDMQAAQMSTAKSLSKQGGVFGGCFITTAICLQESKPDNCPELVMLRKYRDEWLAKSADGKEAIARYYKIAPEIVRRLDRQRSPEIVYAFLRDQYLNHALAQIDVGDNEGAFATYRRMVEVAAKIAGVKHE